MWSGSGPSEISSSWIRGLRLEVALGHPRVGACLRFAGHAAVARAGRAGAMVDLARGLRAGVGQRAGRPAGVGVNAGEGGEEEQAMCGAVVDV